MQVAGRSQKQWCEDNKDCIYERDKNYREENKDRICVMKKKWGNENKDRAKQKIKHITKATLVRLNNITKIIMRRINKKS